jgi:hypothetical protein
VRGEEGEYPEAVELGMWVRGPAADLHGRRGRNVEFGEYLVTPVDAVMHRKSAEVRKGDSARRVCGSEEGEAVFEAELLEGGHE